ncbi:hypothetical protein LEP1GSC026_1311 [Leptospira interrogans str. 2002000623]|nr:hypothetical protein LEP1GSC026_1311 [Leptospira interrogans str. 2002000623]
MHLTHGFQARRGAILSKKKPSSIEKEFSKSMSSYNFRISS